MSDNESTPDSPAMENAPQPENAKESVSKVTIGVSVIILLSLVWYLLADRFMPYTTQARIQGYVVGVAPKVAGLVTQVWVSNNVTVEKDEALFEIDSAQYKIALEKAKSDLEKAHRQVDAGSAAVESTRANFRAALANEEKAQKDATRLQHLRDADPGTISLRRLEISQATLDQAHAQVAAARANIQQAIEQKGGDNNENNAYLNAALAAVDKAELDLANTVVKASSRGVITDLSVEAGHYAGTGSPVMTLITINDVWIDAQFTENNLGHINVGTPTEILFDAFPGKVFVGKVRSIGLGVAGSQNPPAPGTLPTISNNRDWLRQSQRFPVIIAFDPQQDEALLTQLRLGGQASVIAYSEGHSVLKILGKAHIRIMSWFSYAY